LVLCHLGTSNLFGNQASSTASTGLFGAASTGTQSSLFNSTSGFQSSGNVNQV